MNILYDYQPDNLKIFLGGTCNESTWREKVMKVLDELGIEYFNPVVDDWTEECYQEELRQRQTCSHCLYMITPKMTGVYSIAEVIDDSNKKPEGTLFCFIPEDDGKSFNDGQIKSLDKVGTMVANNGGRYFENMENLLDYFKMMPSSNLS